MGKLNLSSTSLQWLHDDNLDINTEGWFNGKSNESDD